MRVACKKVGMCRKSIYGMIYGSVEMISVTLVLPIS